MWSRSLRSVPSQSSDPCSKGPGLSGGSSQVQQVLGPQDARADVLQLYSGVSHAARVLDASGFGEAQVVVQHLVHGGLPAVANGVSHDAVRAVSRVVQDRSLGQSFCLSEIYDEETSLWFCPELVIF